MKQITKAAKIFQAMDGLLGGMMIAVIFLTFGAYSNFTMPTFVCGIVFLLVQKRLALVQNAVCRAVSVILRGCAMVWICFLVWTIFGIGTDDPRLYPVKKLLYTAGNYSDSALLDLLPEEIPECKGYKARFGAPMAGQDAHGWVNITFTTDERGLSYLRSQAESRGGTYHKVPDEEERASDPETAKMLDKYLNYANILDKSDMTVTEVYTFPETRSQRKPCYLLNADTGQAVLNW